MRFVFTSILLAAYLLVSSSSCKKKVEDPIESTYKKGDMLNHIGSQIILPGFVELNEEITSLKEAWDSLVQQGTEVQLVSVQNHWKSTVLAFQDVKMFEFGPSAQVGLRSSLGTFPTDTVKIKSNISNADYNLGTASNIDASGLPALEFLFFRSNALDLLAQSNTQAYVNAILNKSTTEIAFVLGQWQSGYLATFQSSTGTESTSAFSLLVNEFNKEYELAKNAKLGIPLGKQSLGIAQYDYIEAPFARFSNRILERNARLVLKVFQGNGKNGVNNLGFDDYLIALDKSSLATEITTEMSAVISAIAALNDDLRYEIDNNTSGLNSLYVNMQNLVVHYKTDMTSAFGVLITYQDNDGD